MTAKRQMLGTVLGGVSCAVLVGIAFLFVMRLPDGIRRINSLSAAQFLDLSGHAVADLCQAG